MDRPARAITIPALALAIAAGLLAGCASPRETAKPTPELDEALEKYEAEFRPSDHDPEPASKGGQTGVETITEPDTASVEPSSNGSTEMVPGFRVQIFSSANIDEANAKKAEGEALFPEELFYVEYDPPTYKVRAGNFQNRFEAERFAKQASARGFQNAWTVPERVYKQPPAPSHPGPGSEEKQ
jgi:hypothetical protein